MYHNVLIKTFAVLLKSCCLIASRSLVSKSDNFSY